MTARSSKYIKTLGGSYISLLTVCLVQIAKLQVSRIGQEGKVGKGGRGAGAGAELFQVSNSANILTPGLGQESKRSKHGSRGQSQSPLRSLSRS